MKKKIKAAFMALMVLCILLTLSTLIILGCLLFPKIGLPAAAIAAVSPMVYEIYNFFLKEDEQ